jgi:hypothetical protein
MNDMDTNALSMDRLPVGLWLDILLEYSTLEDERHFVNTCRWTKYILSPSLTQNRRRLLVNNGATIRLLLRHPILAEQMMNLHYLNLGSHATDELLVAMHSCMPMLQILSMVGSGVTGAGFITFGSDPSRCRRLELLDITLCTRVSYSVTLVLRRVLLHPKLVIRRIPRWMEGHFETPFENDGIHTYWADSTFSFDRKHCNCGWVEDLWDWRAHNEPDAKVRWHGNRLRFVTGHPDLNVALYLYTPGVTLIPVSDDRHGFNEQPNTIVVAQSHRQMEPPHPSSDLYHSNSVLPMGESKYFHCDMLEPRVKYVETERHNANVMVTCMARKNLEQLMPPACIVQQIETSKTAVRGADH